MNFKDLAQFATGLSEAHRPMRLRLAHESGLLDDVLMVKRAVGTETICGGIEYQLFCVSTDGNLALKEFVAAPVEIQFVTDRGNLRSVCGIVAQVASGQGDGALATYQLVVRDALALMEQRINTRVFRHKSELEITEIIIGEWRKDNSILADAFDVDWSRVTGKYPAREFTMQHNESDAAFLRRLWKRRGLSWFIRPGHPTDTSSDRTAAHVLVLFDDSFSLAQNAAGTVRFHRDSGVESRDVVTNWGAVRTLKSGLVTRQSWDYLQARAMSASSPTLIDQGLLGNKFSAALDDYQIDVPHAGDDGDDYRILGALRVKRHEYESKCFFGEGSVRDLCVGEWIELTNHPEIDTHAENDRQFIITRLIVDAENNLPKTLDDRIQRLFALSRWGDPAGRVDLQQANEERGMRYANQFACVRRSTPIVPAYDARTDLPSPQLQTAIVVGPPGEEVHCDEYGRVKVRFPHTRSENHAHANSAGASDSDADSAWIRVASNWASEQWGAITLPRVGDEVIVDFLGGDPDKPIIVAQVYNGKSLPPTFSQVGDLPGNRYLSGIKSKEIQGSGFNQLRFDDTPAQINVHLSSQHAASELNLGWLTHPRNNGRGESRGEGAELRTDQAVTVRGAKGVLISADGREQASGTHLARDEMLGVIEILRDVQERLAELALKHHADETDGAALRNLAEALKDWEAGSNTQNGGSGHGGQPIVAMSAPAGIGISTQKNIAIGAQTQIDMISVGNTQMSIGKRLCVRVAHSISLFAQKLGIKLIAAGGKIEIQTHQDDVEVVSAKRIVLSAADEIVLQAPKVRFVAQGAQVDLGGGAIVQQSSGAHTIKSSKFDHVGPGSGTVPGLDIPTSSIQTDERFVLARRGSGRPHANQRYRIDLDDGRKIEGVTDHEGRTELTQDEALKIARLTLLKD